MYFIYVCFIYSLVIVVADLWQPRGGPSLEGHLP